MGVSDNSLVREPLKEHPLPGEPKAYDSVQVRLPMDVIMVMPCASTYCKSRTPHTTGGVASVW